MQTKPFIPKDDQRMPDYYGMHIIFHDSKSVELDVVSHKIIQDRMLQVITHEDEWKLFPIEGIKEISFDKQWSKLIAIRAEQERKKDGATDKKS